MQMDPNGHASRKHAIQHLETGGQASRYATVMLEIAPCTASSDHQHVAPACIAEDSNIAEAAHHTRGLSLCCEQTQNTIAEWSCTCALCRGCADTPSCIIQTARGSGQSWCLIRPSLRARALCRSLVVHVHMVTLCQLRPMEVLAACALALPLAGSSLIRHDRGMDAHSL
jgi:hypothetical protein